MTLLDAPSFDYPKARRRRILAIAAVIVCLLTPVLVFTLWNWPSEHRVNTFFAAVERQDYPKAFGIWNNDPDWQAHPQRHGDYPYSRFLKDWGPTGDFGVVASHQILYATSHLGNVCLLAVEVKGKKRAISTFAVSTKDHTVDFAPFDLTPGKKVLGLTRWQISMHTDETPVMLRAK
jgi:hypothetical protein